MKSKATDVKKTVSTIALHHSSRFTARSQVLPAGCTRCSPCNSKTAPPTSPFSHPHRLLYAGLAVVPPNAMYSPLDEIAERLRLGRQLVSKIRESANERDGELSQSLVGFHPSQLHMAPSL